LNVNDIGRMLASPLSRSGLLMPGIVQRILEAEVSAADLDRALGALNEMQEEQPEDDDIWSPKALASRIACLIRLFGEPGRHEVSARIAAIDCRLQAMAGLTTRSEFNDWSIADIISWTVFEAAATEPLIEIDGQPGFDADRFFQRLSAMREERRNG
jgi:hypothetical protein